MTLERLVDGDGELIIAWELFGGVNDDESWLIFVEVVDRLDVGGELRIAWEEFIDDDDDKNRLTNV